MLSLNCSLFHENWTLNGFWFGFSPWFKWRYLKFHFCLLRCFLFDFQLFLILNWSCLFYVLERILAMFRRKFNIRLFLSCITSKLDRSSFWYFNSWRIFNFKLFMRIWLRTILSSMLHIISSTCFLCQSFLFFNNNFLFRFMNLYILDFRSLKGSFNSFIKLHWVSFLIWNPIQSLFEKLFLI